MKLPLARVAEFLSSAGEFDSPLSHVDAALVAKDFDVLETSGQIPRAFDDADSVVREGSAVALPVGSPSLSPGLRRIAGLIDCG